jgi:hypothetical protein
MVRLINTHRFLLLFFVLTLSGCSTLDIKPWSAEEMIDEIITSTITVEQLLLTTERHEIIIK